MEPKVNKHSRIVQSYFDSPPGPPLMLSERERQLTQNFLQNLYRQFSDLNWITSLFHSALNAYWNIKDISPEAAVKYEGSIGYYLQRMAAARQFSRDPSSVMGAHIREPAINTERYWTYNAPYPPNIEEIKEPYRSYFILLDDLVRKMDARGDPQNAVVFLASLMAGFVQTYPSQSLDKDPSFKHYVRDEVQGEPSDDDYSYYLYRMLDYSLFDRY